MKHSPVPVHSALLSFRNDAVGDSGSFPVVDRQSKSTECCGFESKKGMYPPGLSRLDLIFGRNFYACWIRPLEFLKAKMNHQSNRRYAQYAMFELNTVTKTWSTVPIQTLRRSRPLLAVTQRCHWQLNIILSNHEVLKYSDEEFIERDQWFCGYKRSGGWKETRTRFLARKTWRYPCDNITFSSLRLKIGERLPKFF